MRNKKTREEVHLKCKGCCGYCGKEITYKQMQVDHIVSKATFINKKLNPKQLNHLDNLMPTCARCNGWKSTFPIESFRREIKLQPKRLSRDKAGYNIAMDFGLLKETKTKVKFYFESLKIKIYKV